MVIDNFDKLKSEYCNFECEDDFYETDYYKCIKNKINNKAVFLITKSKEESYEMVSKIINKLKGSKFIIYVREYYEDTFKDYKNVIPVKKDSIQYYTAMTTSKYIFFDTTLYADFVKKEGQILFDNTHFTTKKYKDRLRKTIATSKSDYRYKQDNKWLSKLAIKMRLGLEKKNEHKSNKKKILFVVNVKKFDLNYIIFQNIISNLDLNNYEVCFVYDGNYTNKYSTEFSKIDPKVCIYEKKRRILSDSEQAKAIQFLKTRFVDIANKDEINKFISNDLFKNEIKRVTGRKNFDIAINIGCSDFYWNWLVKNVADNTVLIDNNCIKEEVRKSISDIYNKVFINGILSDLPCEELSDNIFSLPYIPCNSSTLSNKEGALTVIDEYDSFQIIEKGKPEFNYISTSNSSIPYFIDKEASYYPVDIDTPLETINVFLEKLKNKNKMLVIFDFYNKLAGENLMLPDNCVYSSSRKEYYALLSRFAKGYILKGENSTAFKLEAVKANIEFETYDLEFNMYEEVKYKFDFSTLI